LSLQLSSNPENSSGQAGLEIACVKGEGCNATSWSFIYPTRVIFSKFIWWRKTPGTPSDNFWAQAGTYVEPPMLCKPGG